VSQLAELLWALGPETGFASCRPIHLVGSSMGGAISAKFAAVYPHMVLRLMLVAPAGLPVPMPFIGKVFFTLSHRARIHSQPKRKSSCITILRLFFSSSPTPTPTKQRQKKTTRKKKPRRK
jgi:pimeloyl-ACP methyl ester carboxylesterase